MRFEEKLRKMMLLKGFNQQKLARMSQVSDSEVSRILAGKSQPGLENALRLAKAVGVSLDYLADDALHADPARAEAEAEPPADEREVVELGRELGLRQARRLLESAAVLGYEVAIRRLMGVEMKPIIEPADPRPALPVPLPANRASSA